MDRVIRFGENPILEEIELDSPAVRENMLSIQEGDLELDGNDVTVDNPENGKWYEGIPKDEQIEDPEENSRCIEEVRKWINENEDSFRGRTDDSFILRFLRVDKFNVEKVKKRIFRHYQLRRKYEEWYSRTEENENMVEDLLSKKLMYSMDYSGDSNVNVVIAQSCGIYPLKYSLEKALGATLALMSEIIIEDPRTQTHGTYLLGDCADVKWDILVQATPMLCYKFVSLGPVSPAKIKAIHVINAPWFFHKLLQLIKYFLGKKLGSRFFVHKDLDSLHEQLPPKYLPFELGGTAGPTQKFVDSTIQSFRDGKRLNARNSEYGINIHSS